MERSDGRHNSGCHRVLLVRAASIAATAYRAIDAFRPNRYFGPVRTCSGLLKVGKLRTLSGNAYRCWLCANLLPLSLIAQQVCVTQERPWRRSRAYIAKTIARAIP